MKHKITKRLILYFSITLLGFALIIGILFSMLFMHYSKSLHASDLKKRAISMADTISKMPDFEAEHEHGPAWAWAMAMVWAAVCTMA